MHNTNNQIKFKTSMLKSSLYDYSDTYILLSETITVIAAVADNAAIDTDKNNKQAIFKNFLPFAYCITETNNTQLDNAKDLDVVIWMYNLIQYSHIYWKYLDIYISFAEICQIML